MSKSLKGYPFSDEPLNQILEDLETHGAEDRSLLRDYAREMARRLRALDEMVERNLEGERRGEYSGSFVSAWKLRSILDGETL